MKRIKTIFKNTLFVALLMTILTGCAKKETSSPCAQLELADKQLQTNLKMYETVWHDIVNKRQIDLINDSSFTQDITLITAPENIVGIEGFKAYYQNYLTGFSDITFTIVDAFGQGDKIAKHWKFTGKHTGEFFGIPATGKDVTVEGVTLVVMKNGKISQERDFLDNLEFMQQLGVIPR